MADFQLVGKKLGDYIMREKLTSGGMAEIYLGEDEKLKRRAAIKILQVDVSDQAQDDVLRSRFEREAQAVARLEHDSIVPIYQFGEEGNLYFIAMRFIDGNDLADELKRYKTHGEKMPPKRMLNILAQVARGLDYAHKSGIIHRDVKPSNILLQHLEDGEVKAILTDFGLVLWEDVDKTLGTAFGTPRYISPEQATDSQSAVPQSDIYSLAVIVYEILTGQTLFTGSSPMEVALSHITEAPIPPRSHDTTIPRDAQSEILRALQKDASKRQRTATEFIDALKRAYDLDDSQPEHPNANASAAGVKRDRTKPLAQTSQPPPVTQHVKDLSWERVTTAPDTQKTEDMVLPSPIPVEERQRDKPIDPDEKAAMSLPVIAGSIVVLAVIVATILFVLNGFNQEGTVSDTPNLDIRYNRDYFALINISENSRINLERMTITSSLDEQFDRFTGELLPDDCVFISRQGNIPAMPDDWNCQGDALTFLSSALFWHADDGNDTQFTVYLGNTPIATCDTNGRAVDHAGNQQCPIVWSQAANISTDEE